MIGVESVLKPAISTRLLVVLAMGAGLRHRVKRRATPILPKEIESRIANDPSLEAIYDAFEYAYWSYRCKPE
jgi:uncharacterized protein YdeI (YjbR/CyaY-like superfamily)